jgi:hypothetical protein
LAKDIWIVPALFVIVRPEMPAAWRSWRTVAAVASNATVPPVLVPDVWPIAVRAAAACAPDAATSKA